MKPEVAVSAKPRRCWALSFMTKAWRW